MPPEDSVANKTVGALTGIPFESIIGGPLSACIKAQAEAAVSTVNFIEAVGLQQGENNTKEAVYVVFSYLQNGRRANISVPLLTIVPIPYIAINNIEIDFKVAINGTLSRYLISPSTILRLISRLPSMEPKSQVLKTAPLSSRILKKKRRARKAVDGLQSVRPPR